jgi:capsular exopolysaccharide synthesis family protein
MPNSKGAIMARGTERSPESEAIRNLRTNLFLSRRREPYRSVLITSSVTQEGKSFITANLAVSFAAAGLRTILVDGDLRRPTQHAIFDLPNFFGLADLLNRDIPPEGIESGKGLQSTEVPNLLLLSAGRHHPDPAILLNSPHLDKLMRELGDRADIVLVDSPPVLTVPDAVLLGTECSATLLVVNDGVTSRTEVKKAAEELLRYQVNLAGTTFNNVKQRGKSYRSYYEYETSHRRSLLTRLWARLPVSGTNGKAVDDPERLLGLKEMAAYLGIEPRTARRWCKDRRIPAIKKNLSWYVRRGDLQAMVTRQLLGEPEESSVDGTLVPALAPTEAIAMLESTWLDPEHKN